MSMENIDHVVVVMMENRSFDHLLGWLYANEGNRPPHNLPPRDLPTYDGLEPSKYSNRLDANSPPVFASRPPRAWPSCPKPLQVPTPNPNEQFAPVIRQLYDKGQPVPGDIAPMSGFLADYATTSVPPDSAAQIMEGYGPEEANVINQLARSFAVCDRWFSSMPTETWPNRSFVHTGSSEGLINNEYLQPNDLKTIFNVLEQQGKSWAVFSDAILWPALTKVQFRQLWALDEKFKRVHQFKKLCRAKADAAPEKKLPAYAFLEPRFAPDLGWLGVKYPNDFHPPHNVGRGDRFLAQVYDAVRASPYRDRILLVIVFDEHGGCYDHVPPPWGAQPPEPNPVSKDKQFKFDRFGVRVPAIVISSHVRPGTVFRAEDGATPFDHTSILATLRDWLKLDANPAKPFLPSPRIKVAPTLDRVLELSDAEKNVAWPKITAKGWLGWGDRSLAIPMSDLQRGVVAHSRRHAHRQREQAESTAKTDQVRSYGHALFYFLWAILPVRIMNTLLRRDFKPGSPG
jgi:phospholipase C